MSKDSGNKKTTVIRADDWLQELQRVMHHAGDEGQTSMEIAKSMGVPQQTVRELLSQLHEEGRLIRGVRVQESLDGSMRRRPVYRIKKGKA